MARWFSRRKNEQEAPDEDVKQAEVEEKTSETAQALEAVSVQGRTDTDSSGREGLWRRGLARLRRVMTTPLEDLFRSQPISEELFSELEEILISADVGVHPTAILLERLKDRCQREKPADAAALKAFLKEEMQSLLEKLPTPPLVRESRPWVILMVGVNGVGKTTTIAKLAARFSAEQKKVLLVAADTFRAAAIEQLEVWADRLGIEVVKHKSGASPAAVAFDGIHAGRARQADVIIIDTAGRLHTKMPLMDELKKVHRVISKELAGAPHEILLVLDASTGQNAISQARTFQQVLPLTGVILAKLDGSAKGGVAFAVVDQLRLPIRYVGLGEQTEDLRDFSAKDFIEALFMPAGSEISLDRKYEDP